MSSAGGPKGLVYLLTYIKSRYLIRRRRKSVHEKASRFDLPAVHTHSPWRLALVNVRPADRRRTAHVFTGDDTGLRAKPV